MIIWGNPNLPSYGAGSKNVDLKQGTATLDAYMDDSVPLRFDAALGEDMLKLETKHVRVDGPGLDQ